MTKKLNMEDLTLNNDENQYKTLVNSDNRENNDELSMRVIKEFFSKKNRKTMSRIKFEQVSVISKLYLFSKTFGDPFAKDLADLMLDLQISTSGLGRRESVQMIQQRSDMYEFMQQNKKQSKDIFR